MNKARFTRIRKYGEKYMSPRGLEHVAENLKKARLVKAMKKVQSG